MRMIFACGRGSVARTFFSLVATHIIETLQKRKMFSRTHDITAEEQELGY